jgi:hypothetical protein
MAAVRQEAFGGLAGGRQEQGRRKSCSCRFSVRHLGLARTCRVNRRVVRDVYCSLLDQCTIFAKIISDEGVEDFRSSKDDDGKSLIHELHDAVAPREVRGGAAFNSA